MKYVKHKCERDFPQLHKIVRTSTKREGKIFLFPTERQMRQNALPPVFHPPLKDHKKRNKQHSKSKRSESALTLSKINNQQKIWGMCMIRADFNSEESQPDPD